MLGVVMVMSVATSEATAESTPSALATRRAALIGFGVAADDAALVQGERAASRCESSPVHCEIAASAFDLAAARLEFRVALELSRSLGVRPTVPPRERAFTLAAQDAPDALAALRRAEAASASRPDGLTTTWLRLARVVVHTRVAAVEIVAALSSRRVAPEAGDSLEQAQALARAGVTRAVADEDAYRARRRAPRDATATQLTAARSLAAGIEARIADLATERVRFTEALARARAIEDPGARLDALMDLQGDLETRARRRP